MNDGNEQARELLERLLAGERGDIVLHLAMLVEKSSALDHGDEHYRQILPPNLAELSLDPTTSMRLWPFYLRRSPAIQIPTYSL